ncbi:unnamed protein product [Amoebophrya sp. A25]|nr:unnamed protein product [Amoebophrya sp. A25]|eukprot:GSA25T00001869001.1
MVRPSVVSQCLDTFGGSSSALYDRFVVPVRMDSKDGSVRGGPASEMVAKLVQRHEKKLDELGHSNQASSYDPDDKDAGETSAPSSSSSNEVVFTSTKDAVKEISNIGSVGLESNPQVAENVRYCQRLADFLMYSDTLHSTDQTSQQIPETNSVIDDEIDLM